ncbi:hypothetical protein NQ314_014683 [Rhamnusium bicolor]|uniref:tRNA-splicing endonuclease subunit Sen54 N-terminal domain-containing protein n=1 Tax=Rhamnusium bicolor TaxID=1586634 RepID=A0AAV8X381_9CUCU|nr:hypothetical protein NQ314_014683 [Rhamnusium bicolor]
MEDLAKKLINDHRSPLVKVDLPGTKLFLKSSTLEEVKFIEKHQNNLENILRHKRVERRCARSQAIWSPETNLAKVTKVVKTLNNFGYQDKNGIFLYPEETLFLMETNRLEVTHNEIPITIQESYMLISQNGECSLTKYRVYKKLVLLGYKLIRYQELLRRQLKDKRKTGTEARNSIKEPDKVMPSEHCQKRCVDECDDDKLMTEHKKLCIGQKVENYHEKLKTETNFIESGSKREKKDLQLAYIQNLFEKLRQNAPREYKPNIINNEVPDYCVFLPHKKKQV